MILLEKHLQGKYPLVKYREAEEKLNKKIMDTSIPEVIPPWGAISPWPERYSREEKIYEAICLILLEKYEQGVSKLKTLVSTESTNALISNARNILAGKIYEQKGDKGGVF
jgi:hypothetical protein